MGRRVSYTSDFEAWREEYRERLLDEYHDTEFVAESMKAFDDEIWSFGADPGSRDLAALFAPAQVFARRRERGT